MAIVSDAGNLKDSLAKGGPDFSTVEKEETTPCKSERGTNARKNQKIEELKSKTRMYDGAQPVRMGGRKTKPRLVRPHVEKG